MNRLKLSIIIKLAGIILVITAAFSIAGCGKSTASTEKVFYYGDTTFNAEMMRQMSTHITDIQAGRA